MGSKYSIEDDPHCAGLCFLVHGGLIFAFGIIPFIIAAYIGSFLSVLPALTIALIFLGFLVALLKGKSKEDKKELFLPITIAVSSIYGFGTFPIIRAIYRFLYSDPIDISNLPGINISSTPIDPIQEPSSSSGAFDIVWSSIKTGIISLFLIGFGVFFFLKRSGATFSSNRQVPSSRSNLSSQKPHSHSSSTPSPAQNVAPTIISNYSPATPSVPTRPHIPAPFMKPIDPVTPESIKSPTIERRQDVTGELKDLVQEVIDSTCIASFIGIGRDARLGGYDRLEVVNVERLHNKHMSLRYYLERDILSEKYPTPLPTVKYETYRDWAVKQFNLKTNINEAFLFHGTKPEYVEKIISDGFEERKSNTGGLFGAGVYFADHSTKSDEYVTSDSKGNCYIFLARVLLGDPYKSLTAQNSIRMAPNDKDSVLGLCKRKGHPTAFLEKYPEFVVYDGNRCYPELLITYKRTRTRSTTRFANAAQNSAQNCSIM